ncbi:MAG: hypothetical protein GXP62_10770, partial [Oligoflexia bacterium]|nr:hypothetical protein [Oligoflexia bacterium]
MDNLAVPIVLASLGWLLLSCTSAKPGASPSGSGVVCPSPTTWYADTDGDSYGAGAAIASSCVMPADSAANTDDCDDTDAAVNPDAVEMCNGIDDDCDGVVDPPSSADVLSCYTDADGDGYGNLDSPVAACDCTDGLSANADDCDDSLANVYPGAEEILYDGIDEACDGLPGDYDRDGDGYDWDGGKGVDGTDCDDADPDINPSVLDLCDDDIDQDCDGVIDECGFSSMTDAGDAWWTVSRNADLHPLGFMGNHLAYAGDSDGDGRPELVAYEGYSPVDDAGHTGMAFRLVEAPSNTSGGSVDVDDATIARWVYPDAETVGWTEGKSLGANEIDASQDFDGDGIVDYMFGNSGTWYEPSLAPDFTPNALSLWYGPPDYQDKKESFMDMADAQTATITTGDFFFLGSFAVTVPPGGSEPWQVAAHIFPGTQDGLGLNHAALAL